MRMAKGNSASNMAKSKQVPLSLRYLELQGKTLPPSIPLILPSTHKWDSVNGKVVEVHDPNKNLEDEHGSRGRRRPLPRDVKLVVVEDAMNLLRTVRKPLAVLSICGPFRSGKSYFLSRLLGEEFFKVGHTMRACTIGLWVSTALLECEDYALLLVDTQGVDSISLAETVGTNLMSVTALLSSYLIYNSKKVPNNVDVEKLRICCLLSSAVLCRITKQEVSCVDNRFYPHLLWLLRDVHLYMTDEDGKLLEPTEYLRTRVLKLGGGGDSVQQQGGDAGMLISSFFRSVECRKLPLPSCRNNVLKDMFGQQDKLSEKFSRELSGVLDYISRQSYPKPSMDGSTYIDGPAFTELVSMFVSHVNSDDMPDFRQGWMAQVRVRCNEIVDELAIEYREALHDSLSGLLPMEEVELMRVHTVISEKKQALLHDRLLELDPLSLTVDRESAVTTLKLNLVQYDERQSVVGGALYPFLRENYSLSKTECDALWNRLVKGCGVHDKFTASIGSASPVDIAPDMKRIEEEFKHSAIGPAKNDVLMKRREEVLQLSTILHKLPGEPCNLKVIGVAYNRVKLSWSPPLVNPEAAHVYYVEKRMDGGQWEMVKTTSKMKVLITDLLDSAKYEFSVVAANDQMKGLEISQNATTKISGMKEFSVNLASGAFPVVAAVNHFTSEHNRGKEVSVVKAVGAIALSTLVTPVTILGFPLSGPLLAISLANDDQLEEHCQSWGDLTPEDD